MQCHGVTSIAVNQHWLTKNLELTIFFALLVTYQVHPDYLRPCLSQS